MCTRKTARLGLIAGALLVGLGILSGCSGEEMPYFEEPKVSLQGSDCLHASLQNLNTFFEGTMPDEQVRDFWTCLDTAISSVEKYMVGSGEGGNYKSTDVRWFVGKYFLKSGQPDGIVINDALLDQVMQIKRLFLGGRRDILTRDEIGEIHVIFRELQNLCLRLNPYMRVLFHRTEEPGANQTDLGRAISELSSVLTRIGDLLNRHQVDYEFSDFTSLIHEISAILFDDHTDPDWLEYVRTAQRLKSLFLLTSEAKIEGPEWQTLSKVLGQGLGIFMRVKYFMRVQTLYNLTDLVEFKNLYNGIDQILGEALSRRQDRGFTNGEFQGLLNILDEDGLLPSTVSKEDIQKIWTVLVDRLLTPEVRAVDGLGGNELVHLRRNFEDWYDIQRFMLGDNVAETPAIKEIRGVLASPWPYRTDAEGRLIIDGDTSKPVNPESFTNLNWERALFRLLVRGYSANQECETSQCGLTKEELKVAIDDIGPLLGLMGLDTEGDATFYERLFLEANLFMPRANGDQILNFYEILEYAHFAFAGAKAGVAFMDKLYPECMVGDDRVDTQCFRNSFRTLFAERFAHLPMMVNFTSGLDDKGWSKFMAGLEAATRTEGAVDTPISKTDIGEIAIFMQYIETLMLRYDTDGSGYFDIQEGLRAFDLFKEPLMVLLGMDDEHDVKVIFTYLLKYGEPPNPSDPISLLRYLYWRWTESSWKIHTDRAKIVNILSSLKST